MGAKPVLDVAERRRRLARRHRLAPSARASTPLDVVNSLVALHGTDPGSVFLSAAARLQTPSVEAVEAALYDQKTLIRMLGMRRTMFVVASEMAPVVQAACTLAIAGNERRLNVRRYQAAGFAEDIPGWLADLENATVAALARRGVATAQELSRDVPELKKQIVLAEGKSYAAVQGIATRVLMQLSADGRIVRGRPRGSWLSSQYTWLPIDAWLPGGLPAVPTAEAQLALVRAWLAAFGPGTLLDLKWWTGLTLGEVRRAVAQLEVVEVQLGEGTGLVLADDAGQSTPTEPWVSLLPGLDPTPMGYQDRAWFLGPHARALFDATGNIGPSVWWDGRIVGGWAQRKDGRVACRLLEDVGREVAQRVDSAAHDLADWLGGVRVTPRFRNPLERELAAG